MMIQTLHVNRLYKFCYSINTITSITLLMVCITYKGIRLTFETVLSWRATFQLWAEYELWEKQTGLVV